VGYGFAELLLAGRTRLDYGGSRPPTGVLTSVHPKELTTAAERLRIAGALSPSWCDSLAREKANRYAKPRATLGVAATEEMGPELSTAVAACGASHHGPPCRCWIIASGHRARHGCCAARCSAGRLSPRDYERQCGAQEHRTARMWAWKRLKLRYALDHTDAPGVQCIPARNDGS